ncbi:CidA/LrgA family protein [Jiella sp. M17.18]|uniref:CidA/LrgA family protein n=1 Tax=Jiella sp. M17.18 TaxID=3234247 RepID=UPI0034DDE5F7
MLQAITVIFLCQLAGETITVASSLPLPGPVVGMVLLFLILVLRGGVPEDVGKVGDTLLGNLSLLFVPAGAGILQHLARLENEAMAISVTLVVSTLVTIAVTALIMNRFGPGRARRDASAGEEGGQ